MQGWASYILLIAALFISSLIAAPFLIRSFARTIGWHLRRRTSARRDLIFAHVKAENDDHNSHVRRSSKPEDEEDWEKVESHGAVPGVGHEAKEGWVGVVGFLHPFWYTRSVPCGSTTLV